MIDNIELYTTNNQIMQLYERNLSENEDAQEFLYNHHISENAIAAYHIGYASEENSEDPFAGRIILPWINTDGNVEGFVGINMDTLEVMESPELTDIKQHELFGLSQAKSGIKESDIVIFVSNYVDAIFAFSVYSANVVSYSGTELTQEHIEQIQPLTNKVLVVCSDEEDKVFLHNIRLIYNNGFGACVLSIQKDLAECVENLTDEEFAKCVDAEEDGQNFELEEIKETIIANVRKYLMKHTVDAGYFIIREDCLKEAEGLLSND